MEIALIAEDKKKELLNQLCIAYCGILSKQQICATGKTGKIVSEATGLHIESLLPGSHGGVQQIASRVSYDEIDVVIFFRDSSLESNLNEISIELLRLCDIHNVPVATNIASAEVIIRGIERGDIDWRELVNPKSDYNVRRRNIEDQRRVQNEKETARIKRETVRQNRIKTQTGQLEINAETYEAEQEKTKQKKSNTNN